ncbi:hypothetical protein LOD44_04560 [Xylella fastidiosa subsp. multiplex]|uniref:Uncharacterized protein n=1 Tax=Xylella fastidiosa subsp. multiplex TaxID=644357 RepID=A0A9Q4MK35_XYLFS|nr:hypothetical protein [Xylella fastidiosa]KAJ4853815.1 hypothetical protein XYFPCFBP8418_006225 [Xylella fastidiosa subsp. multiplex]MBE0267986.1 hypothetical protein [Xylella fastidiosa subsp. multiplex]MBE0274569.1 hypothetical protein [Xylella fastidiosa subsp. multiplex]MBE0276628.1 hypothetical protein [Xylella fastidiosa subsp. multiplex]MBE0281036.1 hypothetical protein [Xylella fastidiosa subsp. multiplex]
MARCTAAAATLRTVATHPGSPEPGLHPLRQDSSGEEVSSCGETSPPPASPAQIHAAPPTLAEGLVAAMRALQPGDVCNDQCNTWLPSHHTRADAPSDLHHKPDPTSDGKAVDLDLLAMHHRRMAVLAVNGYCGPLTSGLPGRTACCVSPRCGRAAQRTPRGLIRTWDAPWIPTTAAYRPCVSYGRAVTDDR